MPIDAEWSSGGMQCTYRRPFAAIESDCLRADDKVEKGGRRPWG